MKKILFIVLMILSLPLKANELKCEESYEYFKLKALEQIKIIEMRDLDVFLEFLNTMYYPMNFKGALSKKDTFYLGEWVSEKKFKRSIKTELIGLDLLQHKFSDFSFGKPKLNYISENGEICVIPANSQSVLLGREISITHDGIFVRDLQTDKWKFYSYVGIEKKEDMDLLFPGLLSKVRLSQMLTNNMDYVDYNIYIANEMMKGQSLLVPKEEVLSALEKRLKPENEMLKINGYK